MKKKTIVENDKAKIEKLIVELDEKKNAALQGAYQQVNKVGMVIISRRCSSLKLIDEGLWVYIFHPVTGHQC